MLRGQLKDLSTWMVCLRPEPFEPKMFGSRTSGTSTFYTDLHIADDKDLQPAAVESDNKAGSNRNSRILEQQSAASEDGNSQDSDSVGGGQDEQNNQYPRHSFHRIASFGGFPRFRPFVMSTASTVCSEVNTTQETTIESSYTTMSHSVIEYRSSR